MTSQQPNILILMADQLRQDALGCYGNEVIRTPHLDDLAVDGVRFAEACCPTPICVASRMSFITGQRMGRHHWVDNAALPGPTPELPTLMTLLHQAGYHTQGVGKMHFAGRMHGFQSLLRLEEAVNCRLDDDYLLYLKSQGVRTRYPQGLRDLLYYQPQTVALDEQHSQSRWVARESIRFLREHTSHRPGVPFLLWSSWIAPHPPFAPCAPYDRLYDPADMPLPVYPQRPLASIPAPARGHRARLQGAHLDPQRMQRIRALYAGQVSHVDECIGSVVAELKRLGLYGNTVILFASDHGEMLGDHGLSQKNVPYRSSVSVPLLLRWPGLTDAGRACDDLVGLEDVLPTFIDQLGLAYDAGAGELPGRSLLGRPGGGLGSDRGEYVVDFAAGENRWISVRSRRRMYVFWASGGKEELYDLSDDLHETIDLAARRPDELADMRRIAIEWERRWGLADSLDGEAFRTWPAAPDDWMPVGVTINEGRWPERLPAEERSSVESFADAFARAIRDEPTLAPEKLDLATYKDRDGPPLEGTPWQEEWEKA